MRSRRSRYRKRAKAAGSQLLPRRLPLILELNGRNAFGGPTAGLGDGVFSVLGTNTLLACRCRRPVRALSMVRKRCFFASSATGSSYEGREPRPAVDSGSAEQLAAAQGKSDDASDAIITIQSLPLRRARSAPEAQSSTVITHPDRLERVAQFSTVTDSAER